MICPRCEKLYAIGEKAAMYDYACVERKQKLKRTSCKQAKGRHFERGCLLNSIRKALLGHGMGQVATKELNIFC